MKFGRAMLIGMYLHNIKPCYYWEHISVKKLSVVKSIIKGLTQQEYFKSEITFPS